MRPNLASPGLLEQPGSSGCGVRLLARVRQRVRRVDLPTPNITCRLRCRHRRRRPCNLVGGPWQPSARTASCEPPGDCSAPLLAPGSCEPPRDGCGPPLTPGSYEAPGCAHQSLLAAGSLLAMSLLPLECTWVARLQAATLRARPATANPATSRSRCPSRQSQTRMLRLGPLVWSQKCGRWSRKLEKIVLLNHIS
jgi:hypothetical protein